MRLKEISISAFRNIRSAHFTPDPFCTLLYGMNGQGKTNLLETVYLLGNARSFRPSRLSDLCMHGTAMAAISGKALAGGVENDIDFCLDNGVRSVKINGKPLHNASELRGKMTSVVFSPDDLSMAKQGPDIRRKYLDRLTYNWDAGYLKWWTSYQRVLKHRNHLLKTGGRTDLDLWTERLADSAAEVITRRKACISAILPKFRNTYGKMVDAHEQVEIGYRHEGLDECETAQLKPALLELFAARQGFDARMRTTTAGPHRDDLEFSLNSRPLKAFGSQGQQKSFVMSLKLAELELFEEALGESPLFLLDDLTSELDSRRRDNLAAFLAEKKIQVLVTTTDKRSFTGDFPSCAVYSVSNGNLTYEGTKTT